MPEHICELSYRDKEALREFLVRPNGAWISSDPGWRVTVEAVEHGGVLVRTQPYKYSAPGRKPMSVHVSEVFEARCNQCSWREAYPTREQAEIEGDDHEKQHEES
jgi:hypothetical protein